MIKEGGIIMGELNNEEISNLIAIANNPILFGALDKDRQNELLGAVIRYTKNVLSKSRSYKEQQKIFDRFDKDLPEDIGLNTSRSR